MSEPEEWVETVSYSVTKREQAWRALPEYPYWLMTTRRMTYYVFGPGFASPTHWVAGWMSTHNRRNAFDGSVEAETLEDAVKDLPYRVAVTLLELIKADPPAKHGASAYDHRGCRCDICKAAKAAKSKKSRERKKVTA